MGPRRRARRGGPRSIIRELFGNVQSLTGVKLEDGRHQVVFDGQGLASGLYFYVLTTGTLRQTRKALLIK